jgi:hypothetical protein
LLRISISLDIQIAEKNLLLSVYATERHDTNQVSFVQKLNLRNWTPAVWTVPLSLLVEALAKPPYDLGEEDNAPTKAGQEHCAMRRCAFLSGPVKKRP